MRADRRSAPGSARAPSRRAFVVTVLAALALLGLIAAWAVWRTWFAPDDPAAAAASAPVPEHQRSGQLANPWGNAPAVPASPADEAAAAARAEAAAAAASAAASSALATSNATARPFVPPAREAVVQSLAKLRGGGDGLVAGRDALAFVQAALQGGDTAALVATWMIERQCRQLMHWRRMDEWRQRANAGRPVAGASAGRGASLAPLCEQMPDARQVDEALAAAGFTLAAAGAGQGTGPELTRRPIDLAQAVAVGDPLLLAEVIDATDIETARQLLRAWGADARDLESPDVLRGALWLASCTPVDAAGRPAHTSALKRACAEHPALAQACQHHGLCEVRDLRDLLLKSLPPADLAVAERLARGVVGRMGR